MCLLCGPGGPAFGEFSIAECRPERLRGLCWRGTHREAAAGAVRALLGKVQGISGAGANVWSGPIVCLSWNDGPDRLRVFAGISEDSEALAGCETLDLPARKFATAWHAGDDGDVVERYGRMLEWISALGHARDTGGPAHREEYPRDADFDGTPTLRLMLPIA